MVGALWLATVTGNDQGDWFEPPDWIAASGRPERRIRPVSRFAIRVMDADFGAVTQCLEKDGEVEGVLSPYARESLWWRRR